jgi:uncharacterized protein YlxP (DUF503 family)
LTIGIYTLELHLPMASSLKEKRQVLRRLKDRLRSRYNVAVAETAEYADLWQRGGVTIVSVAHNRDALVRLFEAIYRETENGIPAEIIERSSEFIDARDPAPDSWSEDRP